MEHGFSEALPAALENLEQAQLQISLLRIAPWEITGTGSLERT
jgi:hypothetical protein